jgi:hypothetical protein
MDHDRLRRLSWSRGLRCRRGNQDRKHLIPFFRQPIAAAGECNGPF